MAESPKKIEGARDLEEAEKNPAQYHVDKIKLQMDQIYDNLRLTLLPISKSYEQYMADYPKIKDAIKGKMKTVHDQLLNIQTKLTAVQEQIREIAYPANELINAMVTSIKKEYDVDM